MARAKPEGNEDLPVDTDIFSVVDRNARMSAWIGSILFPVSLSMFALGQGLFAIALALVATPMMVGFAASRAGNREVALACQLIAMNLCALIASQFTPASMLMALVLAGYAVVVAIFVARSVWLKVLTCILSPALFALSGLQLLPFLTAGDVTLFAVSLPSAVLYVIGFGYVALTPVDVRKSALSGKRDHIESCHRAIERSGGAVSRYDNDGNLVYLSNASETLFGCPRFELMGDNFCQRVHLLDRPRYLKALSDTAITHSGRTVEVRFLCERDGRASFVWLAFSLSAVPERLNSEGRAEIIALIRDISARKLLEEDLEKTQKRLHDRREAESRFLAVIGHELRTPLNATLGFSDLMLSGIGGELSAEHREYVELMRDSGEQMTRTVAALGDISRLASGDYHLRLARVKIGDVAAPSLDVVNKEANKKGVRICVTVPENLPCIMADERACRNVVVNLLSNAVKFSDEGDEVYLEMRVRGTGVQIIIRDSGIGMSEADIERIGELFFQVQNGLDRKYAGTGLGLAIVRNLVDLHDGSLTIRSAIGEGTQVTVELPIDGPKSHNLENALEEISDRRFREEGVNTYHTSRQDHAAADQYGKLYKLQRG